jgi:hypothetical protein
VRHIAPLNKPVHHVLVAGVAELDDQIVDDRREPRITEERETERVCRKAAVASFTQRDDLMRSKGVEDAGDRIDPDG